MGRTELLELRWWTAVDTEPSLRLTIYALFACYNDGDVDGLPQFSNYAERFAEPERSRRLAEIATVKSNLARFAMTFAVGLRKKPSKEVRVKSLLGAYENAAKKSKKR
jgi:hypothetical protein